MGNSAAKELEEIPYDGIGSDVVMIRVDCAKNRNLCRQQRVMAFPTTRIYNGKDPSANYNGDRTVKAMIAWIKQKVNAHHVDHASLALGEEFTDQGCIVSGSLTVARVPGNFHIEAASDIHNIDSTLTNVSHKINSLYFGALVDEYYRQRLPYEDSEAISPLNDKSFYVETFHKAPHHYLKVVTTEYVFGSKTLTSYQFTSNNRISNYKDMEVPEAKFSYDLSPVSVQIVQRGKPWYDFLTSIMAIIGGTYSVITIIDKIFDTVSKRFKTR